jgi:methionyl aminopeptidase
MSWERNIVIKSPQEIAALREAGRINAMALDAVRKLIHPGVTTAELDAAAEQVIRSHGASPTFKGYPILPLSSIDLRKYQRTARSWHSWNTQIAIR